MQPVLLGGAKMKAYGATNAFLQLADSSQYAVAMTPNAKVRHVHWSYVVFTGCPACILNIRFLKGQAQS